MTEFKICGLTTKETIEVAGEAGAAMIGLVFFKQSPRNVSLETAKSLVHIAKQLKNVPKIVALVVNPKLSELDQIVSIVSPDIIQLHGNESNKLIIDIRSKFNLPIIKAIGVSAASDLKKIDSYSDVVDWYLFDAVPPKDAKLPGGNGLVFNWQLLNKLKTTKPFILSGGLNHENIAEAIKMTKPNVVDVSSGVESSRGVKDIMLIKKFAAAVKIANKSEPNSVKN